MSNNEPARQEPTITRQMLEAGADRLCALLEAGTGTEYVVSQVYLAMEGARHAALAHKRTVRGNDV